MPRGNSFYSSAVALPPLCLHHHHLFCCRHSSICNSSCLAENSGKWPNFIDGGADVVFVRQQSQKGVWATLSPLIHLYPTQEEISSVLVAADQRANTGFTLRETREGLLQSMVEVWRAPFKPTHLGSLRAILHR